MASYPMLHVAIAHWRLHASGHLLHGTGQGLPHLLPELTAVCGNESGNRPDLGAHDLHRPNSLLDRWPILPAGIRGTLHARQQVLEGFQEAPCDVAFFNPYVPAVLGGALTRRQPYVIRSDITPRQFDSMAFAYNHPVDRFGPLRAYKHRAATRAFRDAAQFVCLTTWVRNSYVNDYGVLPERVDVLPVGVDLELWRPDPTRTDLAEDTADTRPLRILFVGYRVSPERGRDLAACVPRAAAGRLNCIWSPGRPRLRGTASSCTPS